MKAIIDRNSQGTGVAKAILTLAVAAALVAASFISSSMLAGHFSSPETYAHQIERLDAKKETVMSLSVGSATASAVISMIPDDTCTPIADQLAGISKDFAVVLAAILLEKYLLTTLGFVFFGFVAPACLIACAVGILMPHRLRARDFVLFAAIRLLVVGGVVWGSVPASIFLTDRIEETYEASISAAIDSADWAGAVSEQLGAEEADEESKGWRDKASDFVSDPKSAFGGAADKVSNLVDWAKTVLSDFVESLAVMAVTTCVIPVLTPMLVLWAVKMALQPRVYSPYPVAGNVLASLTQPTEVPMITAKQS